MDFDLTDDRRMLADSLSRFLRDRYPIEIRLRAAASEDGFSREIWSKLAGLGIVGALLPEEAGGFGGAGFDLAVVFEAAGRALTCEPLLSTGVLGAGLIAELGDESQKEILEDVVAGARTLAFAHYEPAARYDAAQVEATVVDGRLFGAKSVVMNAETSDVLIVSVRESGEPCDRDGVSLFFVDAKAEGLRMRGAPSVDGCGRVADIWLDGAAGARLGPAGGAGDAIERALARAVVALSAEALGAMETAMDLTLDHAKTRKQFGRPIGAFQALQHRMADMLVEIEQARSAVINAAAAVDGPRRERELAVSACKNLIGRVGKLIAEEAIQIHGGIGMTWEYAVGHYAKRIITIDHVLGDADHHLERFIDLSRSA